MASSTGPAGVMAAFTDLGGPHPFDIR
jgi:hypothetical protein